MRRTIFFMIIGFLLFYSCTKEETPINEYVLGKNHYAIVVDGETREYNVHVPVGYDENSATPIVFMLHGGTGSGDGTYERSQWKELGEDENILTVFPTALVYCWTNSNGEEKNDTRWNSYPPFTHFCPDQDLKDDVKYLRRVLMEINLTFNVDNQRVYMAGFSSGGQMAFRCAIEMSDVLAAVVQSGGTHQIDTSFTPLRKLPISFEMGNMDNAFFDPGQFPPLALFDTLLTNHGFFQKIVNVHAKTFGYSTSYTLTGDTSVANTATFPSIPTNNNREFLFTLINGLDHSYPNGANSPFKGANQHWNWMKQFSLP